MHWILSQVICIALCLTTTMRRSHAATIMDVIRTDADLSLLRAELDTHRELVELLESTAASLTLLAPNNNAWTTTDAVLLQQRYAQRDAWQLHWEGVLTYLLWNEVRMSRQIFQGLQQTTAWRDETVSVQITTSGLFFRSPSSSPVQLMRPDTSVDNGVVHIVDGFPLPQFFSQNLWDAVLQLEADVLEPYTRMRELLVMTELEVLLQDTAAMTLLVAPDSAFSDPRFSDDNLETASAILQNHMLPQVLPPALFVPDSQITTLFGQTLTITETEAGDIRIGSANVTQETALLAGNGLIHVVSSLLVPPNLAATSLFDVLSEHATNNTQVAQFVQLLDNSWVEAYSNVQQNYTVFISDNWTLPADTQIPSDWIRHIRRFVAHQTIPRLMTETQLRTMFDSASSIGEFLGMNVPFEADTALGERISFQLDNATEQILVTQSLTQAAVSLTAFDSILADNGIVHFVSNPLIPPFWTTPLLDVIDTLNNLSILQAIIVSTGSEELVSTWNRTLLAPTNTAFLRRGIEGPNAEEIMTDTLSYHLLIDVLSSNRLPVNSARRYATALGRSITVSRIGETTLQFNQQATTVTPNVLHNHGIIHIIDTVLEAPWPNQTDAPTALPTMTPTRSDAMPTVEPQSVAPVEPSETSFGNRAMSFGVMLSIAFYFFGFF